jgi:hypothetical protein
METHQHLQFRESSVDLAVPRQNGLSVVAYSKPYAKSTRRLRRIPRQESDGLNARWGERQEEFSLDPSCPVKPSRCGDRLG